MAFKLEGYIVDDAEEKEFYSWFGLSATYPAELENWLDSGDIDKTVYIHSYGGSVDAGNKMYTAIKSAGNITSIINSVAASAAVLPAIAAKITKIVPSGQIMIHNVSASAQGNYKDMEHMAEVLRVFDNAIRNAYILKTGMDNETLTALMDSEKWFEAKEAKELKFVDAILFDDDNMLTITPEALANAVQTERKIYNCMMGMQKEILVLKNQGFKRESLSKPKIENKDFKKPVDYKNNHGLFLRQIEINKNYGGL